MSSIVYLHVECGRAIVELCAARLIPISFLFHTSGHYMISQSRTTCTLSPQLGNGGEQKRARGGTSLKVIMASYPARGQKDRTSSKSHSHSLKNFKTLHAVYWTFAKKCLPSCHRIRTVGERFNIGLNEHSAFQY